MPSLGILDGGNFFTVSQTGKYLVQFWVETTTANQTFGIAVNATFSSSRDFESGTANITSGQLILTLNSSDNINLVNLGVSSATISASAGHVDAEITITQLA
jgi:hypothetical protein